MYVQMSNKITRREKLKSFFFTNKKKQEILYSFIESKRGKRKMCSVRLELKDMEKWWLLTSFYLFYRENSGNN